MKYDKKKRAVCLYVLFVFLMVICTPCLAFAQDTTLTVTVPSQFLLRIQINGKGEVQVGEMRFSETTTVPVDRHTKTAITVISTDNYEIESILYNGERMTENLQNHTIVLPEPTGDSVLTIFFAEKRLPPQTGDARNLLYPCIIVILFSYLMLAWLTIKRDDIC